MMIKLIAFAFAGVGVDPYDPDKDGEACECLPGGSAYHKSVCKQFRKKYNK